MPTRAPTHGAHHPTTCPLPGQHPRGMGSDGTVGANKEAVKIIAAQDGMHAQAYFA